MVDSLLTVKTDRWFDMTPTGLIITSKPDFNAWANSGQMLFDLSHGSAWSLGDWLAYGEGRGDWGEMYSQAVDQTQKSVSTLKKAVWLSKRFPMEMRRSTLSWSHHAEVAPLTDAEVNEWLDRAEQMKWSREELREHLKGKDGEVTEPAGETEQAARTLVCGHPKQAGDTAGTCLWCKDLETIRFEKNELENTLATLIAALPDARVVLPSWAMKVWDRVAKQYAKKGVNAEETVAN